MYFPFHHFFSAAGVSARWVMHHALAMAGRWRPRPPRVYHGHHGPGGHPANDAAGRRSRLDPRPQVRQRRTAADAAGHPGTEPQPRAMN